MMYEMRLLTKGDVMYKVVGGKNTESEEDSRIIFKTETFQKPGGDDEIVCYMTLEEAQRLKKMLEQAMDDIKNINPVDAAFKSYIFRPGDNVTLCNNS